MKSVVIGTKNKDKCRELARLLKKSGIRVLSLSDFSSCREAVETARTFEGNARLKARHYAAWTKQLTLADDSGLMVNALNGRPGVYSARFAGPGCTYLDNNEKLLRLLAKKPHASRKAKFVCVMALYQGRKFIGAVRGECRGRIAHEIKGRNGFGYDPVFIPDGFKKTFAELPPAAKNKISHRAKALAAAKKLILRYYTTV